MAGPPVRSARAPRGGGRGVHQGARPSIRSRQRAPAPATPRTAREIRRAMIPSGTARVLNRLPGETWKIALAALNAHKMRAALSMIGVVIGSASLVLVVTAGLTGGRYILEQIEGVGSNL